MCNIKIINIKKDKETTDFIYIGRANKWLGLDESKWHNPFYMKNESERITVLTKFYEYIINKSDLINSLHELDKNVIGCYCYDKYCHGDILRALRKLQIKNLPLTNHTLEELFKISRSE